MNNLFEELPSYDIFDIPELLPEVPSISESENTIPNVRIQKKMNLNNLNNPKREAYLRKIRELIEKEKKK